MTLYCLSDEGRYRKVSNSFGVSRAAVSHVRRVCLIVTNVLEPKYLCLPKTKEVELQTKEFEKKHGIPQCLGAVDGKQIFVRQPSKSPTDCVNRKQHYFINLQAVSDYSINVVVEWPGCVHDVHIFTTSSINGMLQEGTIPPCHRTIGNDLPPVPVCLLVTLLTHCFLN